MPSLPYQRVDLSNLPSEEGDPPPAGKEGETDLRRSRAGRVRLWIIPLSIFLCCAQSAFYILARELESLLITSTLIPVLGFGVLFGLVILINPLVSIVRPKARTGALNRLEILCLFTAMLVTAGFATLGPGTNLVPLIPAAWNPDWNTPQRGWEESLTNPDQPALNPKLFIQDEDAIRAFREGVLVTPPVEGAGLREKLPYYREVMHAIPWGEWVRPVGLWLIFIFGCYGIFYSLSYVVLRFWSDREKLTFPLAQLPMAIMPDTTANRRFPAIFYRPGFWAGFGVSGLILSWNAAVAAGWIIPDFRITLGLGRPEFQRMAEGTILEGLGGSFRAHIIFTAIGLAFLLPTHVGSSLWGYYLFGQFLMLAAVWVGLGESYADFAYDPRFTSNFLTAQGGGALLCFATISLYRCLREYYLLARGKPAAEQWRLTLPVLWLIVSLTIVVLWLMWNQVTLVWAVAFVLVFTLIAIGLMRIVAETSMYWFGSFGFFHVYTAFGMGNPVTGPIVAPLFAIYSVFLASMETFVAPSLLNAAKMQKDEGAGRRTFHTNLILSIVLSALFAIAFMVFLSHMRGAQQLHGYFNSTVPLATLDSALALARGAHDSISIQSLWFAVGAGWLAFSLWIRQRCFWFPHPVGYIILVTPVFYNMWFSFFIGWVAKKVTVKFGGKATFDIARAFFIGLIIGEIIAVFTWAIVGLSMGFHPGISFHRYNP